jgi:hypothetical protein
MTWARTTACGIVQTKALIRWAQARVPRYARSRPCSKSLCQPYRITVALRPQLKQTWYMAGMNHSSEKKEKGDDDSWVHGQDVGPLSLSPELLTHSVLPHSLKEGWSRHHLYDTESICEDRSIEAQSFSFFFHWKNLA